MIVGEPHGDTAAERVAEHDRGLFDVERVEEIGDPLGVATDRELVGRQIGSATEARHRRRDDPTALGRHRLDHPSVGVLGERPAVQQHDRHPLAGRAVTGGSVLHERALVDDDHVVRRSR